jgi:hypothetical protein
LCLVRSPVHPGDLGPFHLYRQLEGSGDAVIGIHGPLGADILIGTTGAYLSHGCIRISVPYLVQLREVPAGSPISVCV